MIYEGKQELLLDDLFIQRLQQIFDPIPVPIIIVDKESKILIINDSFSKYLGFESEKIIGKPVKEIDPKTRFPQVIKSKQPEINSKHKFSNGHTGIVHRIPVLDEKGEVAYGFGMVLFDDIKDLKDVIRRNNLLEKELTHYKEQLKNIVGAKYSLENIIGNSDSMKFVKSMILKASKTKSNVLITGESGTGKELIAHSIHSESDRGHKPFVKINCAAIPRDLLESELFGYEEGSFTGARKQGKVGKFELASEGTIFLDEIGDMPVDMQVKILRVLQEREIEKIGGTKVIPVDCRIIAATNKNLQKSIEENNFREDLYYRLNVLNIDVPSLRERKEDIELLTFKLIDKLSAQLGKYVQNITEETLDYFKSYNWPGNIRELENIIERAINMTDSETIEKKHIPNYMIDIDAKKYIKEAKEKDAKELTTLKSAVEIVEKDTILNCLEAVKYNKLKAANILGISRTSLYEKINRYNINEE